MLSAYTLSAGLLADDVTGVGVIDDIAIPFILIGAAGYSYFSNRTYEVPISTPITTPITTTSNTPNPFVYVTYTKVNATTGEVYVGRSSGYGTPQQVVSARDINHHKTAQGFGKAYVSTFANATMPGGYASRALDPSYWAIRGSEQIQIEIYQKAGISGNGINGIGPNNPNKQMYLDAARRMFGF